MVTLFFPQKIVEKERIFGVEGSESLFSQFRKS